ncbi:hypothetical protein KJ632_05870, partial [Patescibacteria group bacterium]|nr:hypothetical protein [Patescibacteria group bacterium]
AGKAYYAAESGVEEALYYLDNELPGWENGSNGEAFVLSDGLTYDYEVKNKCDSYPCFDADEFDVAAAPAEAFYGVLELNETLTLPLFTLDEDGEVDSVKDFTVEYFLAFDPSTDLRIENMSGWDILRWKLFGMKDTEEGYVTESISDFTAALTFKNEVGSTYAKSPSWFGTKQCNGDKIKCLRVDAARSSDENLCNNREARDYYVYESGELASIASCYPIADFMREHQEGVAGATGLNYLSLTNMMNPAMLKDTVEVGEDGQEKIRGEYAKRELSRLYFRVETYDDEVVREYSDIISTGYFGDKKQSLKLSIKRDSYMPVFNFSIYSTYGKDKFYFEDYEG